MDRPTGLAHCRERRGKREEGRMGAMRGMKASEALRGRVEMKKKKKRKNRGATLRSLLEQRPNS